MKKFIKNIILFIIPLLIILPIVEIYLRSIPNAYKLKNLFMENHAGEIETLVFGSSHTYHAINPILFKSKCFNIAYSSQDLKRDVFLFDRFIENMSSLKQIVIAISYHTLPEMMEDFSSSETLLKYYGIYMDYPPTRFSLELTIPQWKNKFLMHVKGENTCKCNYLGFGTDYTIENRKKDLNLHNANITAKYHTNKNPSHVKENMAILYHFANICKEKNIKLIILTTPVTDLYSSCLDPTQLNLMHKSINEILDAYPETIYLNFMNDKRFNHNDFYDVDHLNTNGAQKFTTILTAIIDLP